MYSQIDGCAQERAQSFLDLQVEEACNFVMYERQVYDMDLVFSLAMTEQDVSKIFELIPIEDVNPRELIQYIPDKRHCLFEKLASEYISLDQPGKALILLIEALQTRQLLSHNLTKLALDCEVRLLPEGYRLEEFFKQAKWVMILNRALYK